MIVMPPIQRRDVVVAGVQLAGPAVARLVVEDQAVIAARGELLPLEVERAHVQREAVHEHDRRLAGRLPRLDDLDVQVRAVGGGDGELLVEGRVAELLVAIRVAGRVDRLAHERPLDGEGRGEPGRGDADRGAEDSYLLGAAAVDLHEPSPS
jgi:hypothetical protein